MRNVIATKHETFYDGEVYVQEPLFSHGYMDSLWLLLLALGVLVWWLNKK